MIGELLREFHRGFLLPLRNAPELGRAGERQLRFTLQEEETKELEEALSTNDLIETADALADIVYVAYGTAVQFGIDLDAVLAEVHRSNMSKLGPDGRPIVREDGKILKGPNYFPPDVAGVLGVKR